MIRPLNPVVHARDLKTRLFSQVRYAYYRVKYSDAAPNPYTIIKVNPAKINYRVRPSFHSDFPKFGSYVVDGEWDKIDEPPVQERRNFEYGDDIVIFQSIRDHFEKGVSWEDTALVRRQREGVSDYKNVDHMDAMWDRIRTIENIYRSVKNEGYKTQQELKNEGNSLQLSSTRPFLPPEYHEVTINIGRDGRLIFENIGHHRLAIAKLLEIQQIPVRVLVRHKQWQKIRLKYLHKKPQHNSSMNKYDRHPDIIGLYSSN